MFEVQGRSRSTSVILRVVVLVLLCYTVASCKDQCVKKESSRKCSGRYYTLKKDLARGLNSQWAPEFVKSKETKYEEKWPVLKLKYTCEPKVLLAVPSPVWF